MKKLLLLSLAAILFFSPLVFLLGPNVSAESSVVIYVNEIKLGGEVNGQPIQYVELVNTSTTSIDLNGWTLEYAKEGFPTNSCAGASWHTSDPTHTTTVSLSSIIPAATESTYGLVTVELSLTDNKDGAVHIVNSTGMVMDTVGWGSEAPCKIGSPADVPGNTKSIERYLDCDGNIYVDDDNSSEFVEVISIPGTLTSTYLSVCNIGSLDLCQYILLSEIVPNPVGTDTNNEYVELFNPTEDDISTDGCYLQVGSSKKVLSGVVEPGYHAFYGLTLPNAAGGTATFVTTTTEQVVEYPPDMSDGQSWSYMDGLWQLSDQATPAAENLVVIVGNTSSGKGSELGPCPAGKFRNPETNRCKNIDSGSSLKPCRPDQFRNPETNRCKLLSAASSTLKPCKPGQFRNPETNRCKSLASTSSSLVPCKPGQERNPATNRCRKVGGASTSYVPCKPGYERNPETNRCRKASTSTGALSNTAVTEKQASYPAIASVSALAAGYGIYEYKQEISEFFKKYVRLLTKK